MNELIVHGVNKIQIAIAPEVFVLREKALANAKLIGKITSAPTREMAFESLKEMTAISKAMEAARKKEKSPIDKIVKELQSVCADFQSPMEPEIKRISEEVGAYDLKLRQEAEEIDRQRRIELAKLEAEKIKADEAIALAAQSGKAEELQKALDAKKELKEDILQSMVPIKADKLEGSALRQDWEYEIKDIELLEKSRRDLGDWVPSKSKIKAALERGETIPGIEAKKVAKMNVRL